MTPSFYVAKGNPWVMEIDVNVLRDEEGDFWYALADLHTIYFVNNKTRFLHELEKMDVLGQCIFPRTEAKKLSGFRPQYSVNLTRLMAIIQDISEKDPYSDDIPLAIRQKPEITKQVIKDLAKLTEGKQVWEK